MATDETSALLEQLKKETDFILKAKLIKTLNKEKNLTIKKLSTELRMKPAYVCHILRLNRLPEIVVDGYYNKNISLSHLFIISRLKDEESITAAYEQILTNSLTVLQAEELVREKLHQTITSGVYLTDNEKDNLIGKISPNQDKIKVKIIQTRIKSKIVIEIIGDLEKTTKELKKLLKKLEFWYLD